MKNSITILGIFLGTLALGQEIDQYAKFSQQKQAIELSTGIRMQYVETGPSEGTPVILLHGYTDTGRSFQLMMEELNRINPDLRIIASDLRGHGKSSLPDENKWARDPEGGFAPPALASDIIALMDQKNISEAHVVGHSMGSVVGQELALNYRKRVSSLVLIGTFVNGQDSPTIQDFLIGELVEGDWKSMLEARENFRWPQDAYHLTPQDLGEEVVNFLKENWVSEIATDEAFLEAICQETIQTPLGTWVGAIRAQGAVDNRQALKSLQVPVLALWAVQDMLFPRSEWEAVQTSLKAAAEQQGTKVICKTYGKKELPESGYQEGDLGHNLQWAAAEAVAADVSSFITTGFPLANISYVDPESPTLVITEDGNEQIKVWGTEEAEVK